MAEPGNETRVAAVYRSHLRASHADREQVIATLKAAFVQGRLTKDELDARAGQTFAARTYAELAAITADLPTGLIAAPPPGGPGRARARTPVERVVAGAALIIPLPAFAAAAFLTDSEQWADLFVFLTGIYFMVWLVAGAQMLANWHDRRSPGHLPPGRAQRGRALKGEQDGGMGGDLMLCEARGDVRVRHLPSHGVGRSTWVWKRNCRAGFC